MDRKKFTAVFIALMVGTFLSVGSVWATAPRQLSGHLMGDPAPGKLVPYYKVTSSLATIIGIESTEHGEDGVGLVFSLELVGTPTWAADCGNTGGLGGAVAIDLSGLDPVFSPVRGTAIDCGSGELCGSGSDDGIDIERVSDVTGKNCGVQQEEGGDGIRVACSSDFTLSRFKVEFNTGDGIEEVDDSDDLTITTSFVQDNGNDGIDFDRTHNHPKQGNQTLGNVVTGNGASSCCDEGNTEDRQRGGTVIAEALGTTSGIGLVDKRRERERKDVCNSRATNLGFLQFAMPRSLGEEIWRS